MDEEQKVSPILIYYCMRGQAQAIRGLLCYLQVQFVEVHLEKFQQQKKLLPLSILNRLKNMRIDKNLLPILIDNEHMVCDVYQIMAYLCYRHEREDLLGGTIEEKSRLQELMEIFVVKQPLSFVEFFRFAEFCATRQSEMYEEMGRSYSGLMAHSDYLKEFCEHVQSRDPQHYVLAKITILDFLFLESCTYMVGVFNDLDKSVRDQISEISKETLVDGVKYDYLIDLKIMRDFRERMIAEPFYVKNQDFLESFSIITPLINEVKARGIKRMWIGNPRLIR